LSAKKKQSSGLSAKKSVVDPAALALLSHQVGSLLRFHLRMGITSYPAAESLRTFLRRRPERPLPSRARQHPGGKKQPSQTLPPGPSLQAVREEIVACRQCRLAGQRSGQVLGRGGKQLKLMVVGDWAVRESIEQEILFGLNEDEMFWRMMAAIGLGKEQVYVTNALKCCPLETIPDRDCARSCFAHLAREIAAVKPECILAMGELPIGQILATSTPLLRLRGRFHPYRYSDGSQTRVLPTYHPRFLLANPEMKKMTWLDLQMVQKLLSRPGS